VIPSVLICDYWDYFHQSLFAVSQAEAITAFVITIFAVGKRVGGRSIDE
jgi:hypothetical protein